MSKTGLELLEEISDELKTLRKEVKVLDQNIKKIANSAKLAELIEGGNVEGWVKPTKNKPKAQAKAVDAPKKEESKQNVRFDFQSNKIEKKEAPKKSPNGCICQGKMMANMQGKDVALPDVSIKIYNDKDELVKQTKTNRAGMWMSKLPVGRYVALCEGKYQDKALHPVNLPFEVKPDMQSLEVK